MYWLVIGAVAVAWMVARHSDIPQPAVAVRAPAPQPTASERWNRATGTRRLALVAMALGRVVWVGLLMVIFAAVILGTATWMY